MRNRCCILGLAAIAASGCLTPRSLTVGQLASGVGRGATEVGLFSGVGYVSQTNPPVETKDVAGDTFVNQDVARGFGLPSAEANLSYGFTERISLNVHGSPAGVEPGVKFTLNKSKVAHVALLPALGMGYGSIGTVRLSAGPDGRLNEVGPGSDTSFTFLAGLKLLVSHRSGFFAAVGYQLLFGRSLHSGVVGTGSVQEKYEAVTVSAQHQLGASVGMDIAFGPVHLKPEVAFAVVPSIGMTWYTAQGAAKTSVSSTGGFAFAFLPGFTLSVASPAKGRGEDDEAEERHEESSDDEAAADDEDEAPKQRRHRASDDPPRKRRQVEQDDDDEKPLQKKSDDDD